MANAFPEIEKRSYVLKAIGMALFAFELHDSSLIYMEKSLEITTSDLERYHILSFIGSIELDLSETVEEKEAQDEHVYKAYNLINAGLTLYREREEVKTFAESEDWKDVLQRNIINQARCEIKVGELDKAIAIMDKVYKDMDDFLDGKFVDDITAELEKREDFEKIILVVEQLKRLDLLVWLGFESAEGNDRFQRAAWKCKKEDFLIKTYNTLITEADKYNIGARVRNQLATVYRFVFPNYKEAKRLLFEILDEKRHVAFDDADEDFVFLARLQIADILTEQFRTAVDPKEKAILCGEMKNLALQHSLTMSNGFEPYESQTTVSLALMLGKLGPTSEFQDLMEKTFRKGIDSLTDTEAWNDSMGFRLLAKVLAFIPELRRDAQIAYSLIFSSVDEGILNPQEEAVGGNAAAGTEGKMEAIVKGEAVAPTGVEKHISSTETISLTSSTAQLNLGMTEQTQEVLSLTNDASISSEETEDSPTTEDLNPYSSIFCNGCSAPFSDWNLGSVYLCIVCTNCDLCEDCWKKRDRCNKGEEWTDWKRFCGEGHRYIRGPMVGWKGVKGGVLRFAGAEEEKTAEGEKDGVEGGDGKGRGEEIVFEEWIRGLQCRWEEAWTHFWKREELVVDIC